MKVGVIGGGGTLGSSAAFYLATQGIVSRIVLVDVKENVLKSHAMDLEQAISELNDTKIQAGSWEELQGCQIVLVTASLPERQVSSRLEYLDGNLKIIREIAGYLSRFCPQAVVITATNPIDVFNYALCKLTGMQACRFIGFSRNDSLRLRWAVGQVLNVNVPEVEAVVLGEHGESQVPLLERITVRGQAVSLTGQQKQQVVNLIKTWFVTYQGLNSGRTTGWTSAIGMVEIIKAIVTASPLVIPCSAILQGEYGVSGVSLGVPVRLGPTGVREIIQLDLDRQEQQSFQAAARKVKDLLAGISLG